jgi:hypothetical protein
MTDRLCRVAQRAQVNVVFGVIEYGDTGDGMTCYNTLLCIDAQGQIVGTYRTPCSREAAQLEWFRPRLCDQLQLQLALVGSKGPDKGKAEDGR